MLVASQDKIDEFERLVKSLGTVQYGSQVGGYEELNAIGDPSAQSPAGAFAVTANITSAELKAAGLDTGSTIVIVGQQIFVDNRPVANGEIYKIVSFPEPIEVPADDGSIDTFDRGFVNLALVNRINFGSQWLRMYNTDQGKMIPIQPEVLFLDSGAVSFTNRYRELYLRACELFGIDPNNPLRQIL